MDVVLMNTIRESRNFIAKRSLSFIVHALYSPNLSLFRKYDGL